MRFLASLSIALVACAAHAPPPPHPAIRTSETIRQLLPEETPPARMEELVSGFRITNYNLARESELSGQRTGNHSRIKARGLPGQYAWEFLCSGRGVVMQGTGVTEAGEYVHYVSGGGGFCGREKHVCDCKNVHFTLTNGVYGSTGRTLVENHSIAVDPNVIPYGSFVWIDAMKRWFRADDTGGAIIGQHIDIYVGTQPFVFLGDTSIFVTSQPHQPDDPGPPGSKSACTREGLVCADDLPGEHSMLYHCGGGRLTYARACTWGCRHRTGNGDDACNPRPPTVYCASEGWFCAGENASGRPDALYHCADHALHFETTCQQGCLVDPDGMADRCL